MKLINTVEKKKTFQLSINPKTSGSNFRIKTPKLTAYGIEEIENEISKLSKLIIEYNKIINSKKALYNLITDELGKIKDRFSKPRKTKIIDAVLNYNIEETIQKESVVINITNQGYIKRGALSSLKAQKEEEKVKLAFLQKTILLCKFSQLIPIHLFFFFLHKG